MTEPLSDEELFVLLSHEKIHARGRQLSRAVIGALFDAVSTQADTITALKEQVAELKRLVHVPGVWRCAKCNFVLHKMVLDADTGAVGVKPDSKTEPCPNGCGPLWPMTERQSGNELVDRLEAMQAERDALRKEVAELRAVIGRLTTERHDDYQRGRDEQREKDADIAHETMRAFSKGSLRRPGSIEGYGEYIAKAIRESTP